MLCSLHCMNTFVVRPKIFIPMMIMLFQHTLLVLKAEDFNKHDNNIPWF